MAVQQRSFVAINSAFTLGRIILLIGAIICLLASFAVLKGSGDFQWFEFGVGLSFLGLAL